MRIPFILILGILSALSSLSLAAIIPPGLLAEVRTTSNKPTLAGHSQSGVWIFNNGKVMRFRGVDQDEQKELMTLSPSLLQDFKNQIEGFNICAEGTRERAQVPAKAACLPELVEAEPRKDHCYDGANLVYTAIQASGRMIMLKRGGTCGPVWVLENNEGADIIKLLDTAFSM